MKPYLHEVLPGDEALGAEGVDQGAHVLLVLVGTIQGTNDDLTQHLCQEMLWCLHVPHAVHSFSQVLAAQVLGHDRLLRQGQPCTNHQSHLDRFISASPKRNKRMLLCSQSF